MPGSLAPQPLDLGAVQIPYHFRCPVSLELMQDPVTVSTGQTYDRSSIESWVATGNTTCPVTRASLDGDFTMIPNHTLRRLIQEWCVAHRSFGIERIPTPKQPADPTLVRSLVAQCSSSTATGEFRISALRRLRALSRESEYNRKVVAEFRSPLVNLAFDAIDSSSIFKTTSDGGSMMMMVNNGLAMEALAVASVLPLSDSESTAIANRADRLKWLSGLLRSHDSIDVRINAAAMIESISAGAKTPDIRILIAQSDGIMEGLIAMITTTSPKAAAKAAIRALFSLTLVKQNRELAVRRRATETLVERISTGDLERGDLERALATVELLCRVEGGCAAVIGSGEIGVGVMARVMESRPSDRAAEHAVGVMLAVCVVDDGVQKEAVKRGVLPQLLIMVQGGCTERAKRKAQVLLKLLWSTALASQHDDYDHEFR